MPVFSRLAPKPCSKCMDRRLWGGWAAVVGMVQPPSVPGRLEALVVMVKPAGMLGGGADRLGRRDDGDQQGGASEWGKQPESNGAITRTIRGWAALRSAHHVTIATQKLRKMSGVPCRMGRPTSAHQ